jgi:hypothetical protein
VRLKMTSKFIWVLLALGPHISEMGPYDSKEDCELVKASIIEMDPTYEKYVKCVKVKKS